MALFNFVDLVGPPVPALYLNELDRIRNALSVNVGLTLLTSNIPSELKGPVLINRPSTNIGAFAVNSIGTFDGLSILSQVGAGNVAAITLFATGYGAYRLIAKNQTGVNFVLRDDVAGVDRLSLADNGQFTFAAPSSGTHTVLIHNRAASSTAGLTIRAGSTAFYAYELFENSAGARRLEILAIGSASGPIYGIPADSAGFNGLNGLHFCANDLVRMSILAAGNVFIATPTSGDSLTIGPSVTTGALLATSAALTSGAGASNGTLTNAPSVGNPTKWIKINDNGTIRAIPAW